MGKETENSKKLKPTEPVTPWYDLYMGDPDYDPYLSVNPSDRTPSPVAIYSALEDRDIGTPLGFAERTLKEAHPKVVKAVKRIRSEHQTEPEAMGKVYETWLKDPNCPLTDE